MDFKTKFTQSLEKLRALDPEKTSFGSASHAYNFNPKLSEVDISVFEKANGCKLPESYRTYLSEFGNGGAGPSYGVFALGTMDSGFENEPWPDYVNPSASFRFTEAYNNEEMLYVGEPQEDDFDDEEEYEEAYDEWYEEFGEEYQNQYYEEHGLDQGAIPICHHGCAQRSWLVVDKASPEYGNVWNSYLSDNAGVAPATSTEGERMKFSDWVLAWCAKSLQELQKNSES